MAQTSRLASFGPVIVVAAFPNHPSLPPSLSIPCRPFHLQKKRPRAQATDKPSFGHSRASVHGGGDLLLSFAVSVLLLFGASGGWTLRNRAENGGDRTRW